MDHMAFNSPLAHDVRFPAAFRNIVAELQMKETQRLAELHVDDPQSDYRYRRVLITRDEIQGQSQSVRDTVEIQQDRLRDLADRLRARQPRKIYLTGCGDSYAVMLAVRSLFEEMFGVPCEAVQALELAYYNNRAIDETSLVIGLSATGMTPRTVEALLVGKSRGARTIALTNVETSSLATNADHTLIVQAARKGWPTQASTAAIGLLCALAVRFGEASGEERKARAAEIMLQLDSLPTLIDQAVITHEASARALAKQLANRHFFLFSGGGPAFASAFFGAAKVKECTVDHAEAVSVEEFHHYHSLKAGEPLFLIVPKGKARNRAIEAALQGCRAGGRVFAVAPNDLLGETTELTFTMPDCDETIASALYTIPLQLFSYHLAIEKFRLAGGPK